MAWRQVWAQLSTENELCRLVDGVRQMQPVEEVPDAAVLMGLTLEPQSQLLLTQRAVHLSSHAGEVAFPGGKCDTADRSAVATALRESHEEVGLQAERVWVIGQTGSYVSRAGLKVQPVLALVDPQVHLQGNPDEIAHIFRVPLHFFLNTLPNHDHEVDFMGQTYVMPCFRYQGFVIWGLTAYMWVDVLNRTLGAGIDFPMPRRQ